MPNQFTASLWGDEAFSAILSMKPIPEIINIIARDTSPPLYNLTEHIWFQIFGTSEIAVRSLSFLYYLIAVFFVYKIANHLWDKKTAILASILTFLNPFFFIYAFEGRMYSILAAAVTASMYFFLTQKWVGYVLATSAALYSHHFSIFAVFIQGIWFVKEFFWGKRKVAYSILKSFLAIGILYTPWLIPLYNQTRMVGGGFWLGTPTIRDLGKLILTYLNISLIALIFRDWKKNLEKSIFLLLWFTGPIILTWLISQKFSSIFFDRYLLYAIPGAMLLVASQRQKFSKYFIAITLVFFLVAAFYYFTHPIKRPFRDLATYVKAARDDGDFILNWYSNGTHHIWETKYYAIGGPIYVPSGGDLPFFVGTALMEKDDIITTLPTVSGRIGVVTSGPIEEVNLPGYTKKEEKNFGTLKFLWFSK